ncbi:MAG TPA: alpha/beta hydrolase [Candidatus Dormibacteraeota bacterium]
MALRFRGAGSLDLVADAVGPWDGPPCLLLHGGGQTRHAWGGTTQALADAGFLALTLDQRGHGESGWASDADYSPDAYVADLREVLSQIGRPTALVGASLGGLASLLATGEPPGAPCSALVLVDITPRLDPGGRERIGRFMSSHGDGFASLEEAADAVAAYLPHRPRPADVSGLARNLRLEEDGRYHWHWDPAFVTSNWPPRRYQDPERYERAVAAVDVPLLLVRGARSEVVTEEAARAFLDAAPSAEYVDVADAAHMVAGDRNDAFTAAVVEFLRRRVLRD